MQPSEIAVGSRKAFQVQQVSYSGTGGNSDDKLLIVSNLPVSAYTPAIKIYHSGPWGRWSKIFIAMIDRSVRVTNDYDSKRLCPTLDESNGD